MFDQYFIIGPSSSGKTTYANKHYSSSKYTIIDSDNVWYDLAKKK